MKSDWRLQELTGQHIVELVLPLCGRRSQCIALIKPDGYEVDWSNAGIRRKLDFRIDPGSTGFNLLVQLLQYLISIHPAGDSKKSVELYHWSPLHKIDLDVKLITAPLPSFKEDKFKLQLDQSEHVTKLFESQCKED